MYETSAGGTPSRKCPHYYGGSIRWVKTRELLDGPIFETEECITEEGLANSSAKIFPSHTVLVAMYGATIGQLGVIVHPAATNQACCAVISSSKNAGWAYAYLTLRHARQRLINLRAGAAQQNINQALIRAFNILRPPSTVLAQFEKFASPMLTLSFILHQQSAKLAAQRDLLLPRLISGEVSVSAAERELETAA
jgi:type I restriction enzyme S subunit